MALLERIQQMKEAGQNDAQIIRQLKEEGISPREINETISQSRIKSAISPSENPGIPQTPEMSQEEEGISSMQPSLMQQAPQQSSYPEQSQQTMPMQQYPESQMQEDDASYAYPQQTPQYESYEPYYQQEIDTETINEIASQIIDEKISTIKKQISDINRTKTEINFQIQRIENRLNKIETAIESLQASVIRSIGEYGENIRTISREMQKTQDSFKKVLNPLTDQIRDFQEITGKAPSPEKTSKKRKKSKKEISAEEETIEELKEISDSKNSKKEKKSLSFEDYLR